MNERGDHQWDALELAAAFSFTHELFRPAASEQYEWLIGETCAESWRYLTQAFPHFQDHLDLPPAFGDFESRFIATFDVGVPAPPVPILESHYNKRDPLPKILHENILFYQQFGLRLSSASNESADHLRHQLEFVSYLFSLLARAEASSDPGTPDRAAQICQALEDYLSRHLLSWLPQAVAAAQDAPLAAARQILEMALELSRAGLKHASKHQVA